MFWDHSLGYSTGIWLTEITMLSEVEETKDSLLEERQEVHMTMGFLSERMEWWNTGVLNQCSVHRYTGGLPLLEKIISQRRIDNWVFFLKGLFTLLEVPSKHSCINPYQKLVNFTTQSCNPHIRQLWLMWSSKLLAGLGLGVRVSAVPNLAWSWLLPDLL